MLLASIAAFTIPIVGMHTGPSDQGDFGTCVGESFANAVAQGLLGKYHVAIDRDAFQTMVRFACSAWNGHEPEKMCEEWNSKHMQEGAWVAGRNNRGAFRVRVKCTKTVDINRMHGWLQRRSLALRAIGVITTEAGGRHGLHAVTLVAAHKSAPNMQALNSWGASKPMMDVTRDNFKYAVAVEPVISAVMPVDGSRQSIPQVTKAFKDAGREPPSTPPSPPSPSPPSPSPSPSPPPVADSQWCALSLFAAVKGGVRGAISGAGVGIAAGWWWPWAWHLEAAFGAIVGGLSEACASFCRG